MIRRTQKSIKITLRPPNDQHDSSEDDTSVEGDRSSLTMQGSSKVLECHFRAWTPPLALGLGDVYGSKRRHENDERASMCDAIDWPWAGMMVALACASEVTRDGVIDIWEPTPGLTRKRIHRQIWGPATTGAEDSGRLWRRSDMETQEKKPYRRCTSCGAMGRDWSGKNTLAE